MTSLDMPLTRFARSGDLDIAYQLFESDGPLNIVVVMGLWSHLDFWHENPGYTDFLRGLSHLGPVVVFDKRGYGLSDRWPRVPTLEERMDDIGAVMDAVGMDRAALVAWSEGVGLALMFQAVYPQRVSHLALFEGFARWLQAPGYPEGTPPDGVDEMIDDMVERWGDPQRFIDLGLPPERAAQSAKGERMCLRRNEIRAAWEWMLDLDVRELLPAVTAPTLVMYRSEGILVSQGEYLADTIAGAERAIYSGSNHAPWGEDDEREILARIQGFLTGSAAAPPDPDRQLATVLFTDIVSSTEQANAMRDRAWKDLLDRHDAIAAQLVERYRGHVVKNTGDGILATFDGPGRAVLCARDLGLRLAGLGIEIRAGLHAGEIERRGDDIGGVAVHLASRIRDAALGGEVLASRTVADLTIGSDFRFESRGEKLLKGFDRPWELFALAH